MAGNVNIAGKQPKGLGWSQIMIPPCLLFPAFFHLLVSSTRREMSSPARGSSRPLMPHRRIIALVAESSFRQNGPPKHTQCFTAVVARLRKADPNVFIRCGSGGRKYPILPFTGEISYRCFKGFQKSVVLKDFIPLF